MVYDTALLAQIKESFKVYESRVSVLKPDTYNIQSFFIAKSKAVPHKRPEVEPAPRKVQCTQAAKLRRTR